ncbi:MAG TPA: ribonuclease III [Candidatus Acidoferrales bacterium]|jgi:ribonuclease-3|nr:ribonuclease III [Candidatus Acidoferrales bacterium]
MPATPKFAGSLGYQFRDENLLRLALTHPSVAHESGTATAHNQRLEFLGDAVLGLVLTQKLYEEFPGFDEGPLTKARAKLVNRQALAGRARSLGLGEHLIVSRGEESSGGRERSSALADAYEALLGAIFLDGGFEAARKFILQEFSGAFDEAAHPLIENPKGELQELLQSRSAKAPEYQTVQISGSDHEPLFECAVFHDGMELARGQGKNKKAAESAAALAALETLKR